jgi:hypothetical protein
VQFRRSLCSQERQAVQARRRARQLFDFAPPPKVWTGDCVAGGQVFLGIKGCGCAPPLSRLQRTSFIPAMAGTRQGSCSHASMLCMPFSDPRSGFEFVAGASLACPSGQLLL